MNDEDFRAVTRLSGSTLTLHECEGAPALASLVLGEFQRNDDFASCRPVERVLVSDRAAWHEIRDADGDLIGCGPVTFA